MPMLDEPDGRFGRWGQVASALATFAVLGFLILFVVLDWLLGAPLWFLVLASAPIAIFSIVFGFTVVDDEDLESDSNAETDGDADDVGLRLMEPKNRFGRTGQVVVTVWSICVLMGLITAIVRAVFGIGFDEWNPWAQMTVFLTVCSISFLFEMTTFGEDDDDDRAGLPATAPSSDGANARFHNLANSDQG